MPTLLLLLLLLSACTTAGTIGPPDPPDPPPPPGELALVEVESGLQFPLLVTAPPGDATRLFVVEKRGTIRILKNGALLATPFLDLVSSVSTGSEQGLLGLAFHPDYATNGVFVVSYTNAAGDTRVVTMRVSANPDVANPACWTRSSPWNSRPRTTTAATSRSAPTGISTSGWATAERAAIPAQDPGNLFGSILRYAVDDQGQATIPADNPFVGVADARDEIWSYGLRNPWRFSFDRETGDLYIADVGQSAREEVNVARASQGGGRGSNFGWRIMEGTLCVVSTPCDQTGLVLPVLEYGRTDGCSITGGHVYRGAAMPGVRGHYFYGDYCQGWVRSFRLANGAATDHNAFGPLTTGGQITSFGEDAAGEIYVVTSGGRIFRLEIP
jgi:glucose/arabinose dehydrogenase